MERTLVMLKPDAVQRGFVGRILARFEAKGLKIVALKLARVDRALAERQYASHKGKDFYEPLIRFITSSPMVVMALEAKNICAIARKMMGATFGSDADSGTIRGDFALSNRFNLIHGSDNPRIADKEIKLFFAPGEIFSYELTDLGWVYDFSEGGTV